MNQLLDQSTVTEAAKACLELNELEKVLALFPPCEAHLVHRFTPGLYSRSIKMPAGMVCTSKIHKTEHQFIVSKGKAEVWVPGDGWQLIVAPYHGITKAGTRRALKIIEETIWTTFHPTDKTNLAEVEAELIEAHDIPRQIDGPPNPAFIEGRAT